MIDRSVLRRALGAFLAAAVATATPGNAQVPAVDTVLILAIDVSNSVDDARYALQMEGVARALEDPEVIAAISGGGAGSILLTIVAWSDRAEVALPWQIIASAEDGRKTAQMVRGLPQRRGEYTCVARMMGFVNNVVLPTIPTQAGRIVVDVSGDGIDNCAVRGTSDKERDLLIGAGVTINGLPIIVKGENDIVGAGAYRAPGYGLDNLGPDTDTTTLDAWYEEHVIGGPGSFLKVAQGYEDFGRAFRQKFVTEISGRPSSDTKQAEAR